VPFQSHGNISRLAPPTVLSHALQHSTVPTQTKKKEKKERGIRAPRECVFDTVLLAILCTDTELFGIGRR
jgi:hypothetical protein